MVNPSRSRCRFLNRDTIDETTLKRGTVSDVTLGSEFGLLICASGRNAPIAG